MNFSCNQTILSDSINIVQKAVSLKTTKPILKGILLKAYNNQLKLVGNNLSIGIENTIEANVKKEGSIVISSKLFGEIIRKLPNETINFSVNENNVIDITCLNTKFSIQGQSALEFPEIEEIDNTEEYEINSLIFKNMIRQTIFAISLDDSRPILTGSLIEIKNDNLSMVSIDGYRLSLKNISIDSDFVNKAVIPGKTLSEVNKILSQLNENNEKIKISITDKHIMFNIEKIKIISRLLDGEFIKYDQIIPNEFNSIVKINTSELLRSIERASLLAIESKSNTIKMIFKNSNLNISTNVEIGSVDENVDIELKGKEIEIGFNPKYLMDALKIIDSEEVIMKLTTSVSPCIIKPVDDESYTYLILPVRLS
ncbi:DNA polymerase III subunit beta [Helicovermis profundi]|uniref:Beta sliding clamp n=1 Tax=Helicovermis profundi TaxID=3065157 RepID=A0AAU9E0A0_9FIRM|nr:DNA polymerase III subunit beta [Clostridia bacterium S502]